MQKARGEPFPLSFQELAAPTVDSRCFNYKNRASSSLWHKLEGLCQVVWVCVLTSLTALNTKIFHQLHSLLKIPLPFQVSHIHGSLFCITTTKLNEIIIITKGGKAKRTLVSNKQFGVSILRWYQCFERISGHSICHSAHHHCIRSKSFKLQSTPFLHTKRLLNASPTGESKSEQSGSPSNPPRARENPQI
jgi:hypothetical protein